MPWQTDPLWSFYDYMALKYKLYPTNSKFHTVIESYFGTSIDISVSICPLEAIYIMKFCKDWEHGNCHVVNLGCLHH